ncbi:MAG TPA: GH1 family beta-glucosidase [Tepidisphaeraceae bacterium]|nr:GH1 family beta-glucosidase [Tepidisphaeraceae bacterium]
MAHEFCKFPPGFAWGTATAAYQVEGATAVDGRGPSVWDTFCRRPGAIAMDHTGDRGTDHYHRFKEDIGLMKSLGVKAYRFSVAWPRIVPNARGEVNQKGLDFYSRLIDCLHDADIAPWMTLFHWDLPQWCEDRYRGWESADCARDFADYAAVVARAVGEKTAGIFTINEFACFIDMAYRTETELFAPGKFVSPKLRNQARHHAVLGHGLAVRSIRAACKNAPPIGLAENSPAAVPVYESAEHIAAAKQAYQDLTGMYLVPIMTGKYQDRYLHAAGDDAPRFTEEEMKVIASPLDFVGLNLYTPVYVRADPEAAKGWSQVICGPDYPRMYMPWLNIGPAVMYWTPKFVSELWNVPAIYITENGCAENDRPTAEGKVNDVGRIMYLQQHLAQLHRAIGEGVPVKGYFLWSLMDNFEWAHGYTRRFGIHYVNYETMQRTPKLSAEFYAGVIRRNAVGGASS